MESLHCDLINLKNYFTSYSANAVAPTNTTTITYAKADSGASAHFLKPRDTAFLTNLHASTYKKEAILPNGEKITASHQGLLPFEGLNQQAKEATIYPGLTNESLLSIGQFCDDNCMGLFTKTAVYIIKNNKILLHGYRNKKDGLWDIALPMQSHFKPCTRKCNYVITRDRSKSDLAQYLHATVFSPPLSTLKTAIAKGNFISWPGIRELNFKNC